MSSFSTGSGHKVRVVVSGSFNRHLSSIREAVTDFRELGVNVLSPKDPRPVDKLGQFIILASDKRRSLRGIENRHLAAISRASFLYIESPDGYIGVSTALELGYAVSCRIPVIASARLSDLTMNQYVDAVAASPARALALVRPVRPRSHQLSLLLDPVETLDQINLKLDQIRRQLLVSRQPSFSDPVDGYVAQILNLLNLPARPKLN